MDILDISFLGASYRYAVKFEKKIKKQSQWEFEFRNPQKPKYGKKIPNSYKTQLQEK
jgi:hypothetical protein